MKTGRNQMAIQAIFFGARAGSNALDRPESDAFLGGRACSNPFLRQFPRKVVCSTPQLATRVGEGTIRSKPARIAVACRGPVGLPTALGLAAQGWSAFGADSYLPLISLLQAGKALFHEPGLADLRLEYLGHQVETGPSRNAPSAAYRRKEFAGSETMGRLGFEYISIGRPKAGGR